MSSVTYVRFELLRTFRNRRFVIFSLAFPLALFLLATGPNRNQQIGGVAFALYFMVGMAAWGAMAAVLAGGAVIALERAGGWTRQIRITPLRTRVYFASKVIGSYALALTALVLLYIAGAAMGVRLPVGSWLRLTILLLIGLVPFVALGILLGHVLSADAVGPAIGGIAAAFALLGGVWGPLPATGVLHVIGQSLPSYWLVYAGRVSQGGGWWPVRAWPVLVAWTAVFGLLAVAAYRRDTGAA